MFVSGRAKTVKGTTIRLLKGGMRDLVWVKSSSQTFSERIFFLTYNGVRFLFQCIP